MAKTIKFNLICDGYPVRTIEDLQEHFSIEDILSYYESGLLLRWLEVRGYEAERKKVKEIETSKKIEIIKELVKIFNVETDDKVIEYDTYILGYKTKQEEQARNYIENKSAKEEIITDYYAGYQELVERILNHNEDMAVIKAAINEIVTNYRVTFDYDYRALFNTFRNHAPKAIYAMLMNEYMREKYLTPITPIIANSFESCTKDENLDETKILDEYSGLFSVLRAIVRDKDLSQPCSEPVQTKINIQRTHLEEDRQEMYQFIKNRMLSDTFLENTLGEDLKSCSDKTDPYAKPLEDKGRYMVIKMGSNDRVGAFNDHLREYTFEEVDGKFIILDGLNYKSDSNSTTLYYLEV